MLATAMQEINSKENQHIKFAVSLQDKKIRKREKLCLLESKTVIEEALKKGLKIKQIFFKEEKLYHDIKNLISKEIEIFQIDNELMTKIATTETPPPIFAIMEIPEFTDLIIERKDDNQLGLDLELKQEAEKFTGGNLFLYCENIQDPGNLGSIIRSSFAAGVKSIYLSPSCVDIFNTKTIRSSMGTVFYGSINYIPLEELIEKLKTKSLENNCSLEILGTSPRAETNYSEVQLNPLKNLLLMVGNESQGLEEKSMKLCTNLINIPLYNDVESINVLAATSIVLFSLKEKLENSLKNIINN